MESLSDNEIFNMWNEFKDLLLSTKRTNIEQLIDFLDKSDFKFAPASTRFHHSYRGGLLKHSLEVYHCMKDFASQIEFFELPEDSIIIMSLLHDICKVNMYKTELRNTKNEAGEWVKVPFYTIDELEPLGHADKSIMLIYEYGVTLTKIERACIRNHMGFSEQENTNRVSSLFDRCPQALILYWADLQSAYVFGNINLQERFRSKIRCMNITNSLIELKKPKTITYNGATYELAPEDAEIDNVKVIPLIIEDGTSIKVYAPHGDGLPF